MKTRTSKKILTRAILANQKARTIRNPLRTDPTRTTGMREHFCKFIDRQFDKLKADVLRAVGKEDWLGVGQPVENFNPDQDRDAEGRFSRGPSTIARQASERAEVYGYGKNAVSSARMAEEQANRGNSEDAAKEHLKAIVLHGIDIKDISRAIDFMKEHTDTYGQWVVDQHTLLLHSHKRAAAAHKRAASHHNDELNFNQVYQPFVCNGEVGYFPSRGLIEVPDVRQPDSVSCGAAAAMSVGRYFGVGPESLDQWVKDLGTSEEGTHPEPIVQYLRGLGLRVEAFKHGNLDTLDHYLARGWPVLCCVQDYGPKKSWEHGHYLVVIGHKDGYVFAQDPAMDNVMVDGHSEPISELGSLHTPGRVMVPEDEFLQAWHDEDEHGVPYVRFGIAVGPAVVANCNPSQMRGADGRCGPGIGLDIKREDMPQIRKDDMGDFLEFCKAYHVSVTEGTAPASDLKPTQAEFRQERVDALPDEALKFTVLVSEDDYVLDGTHRWIKHWQKDRDSEVPVLRVGLPVREAIDLMRRFPKAQFVANSDVTATELRDSLGRWIRDTGGRNSGRRITAEHLGNAAIHADMAEDSSIARHLQEHIAALRQALQLPGDNRIRRALRSFRTRLVMLRLHDAVDRHAQPPTGNADVTATELRDSLGRWIRENTRPHIAPQHLTPEQVFQASVHADMAHDAGLAPAETEALHDAARRWHEMAPGDLTEAGWTRNGHVRLAARALHAALLDHISRQTREFRPPTGNTRWAFATSSGKLAQFGRWLRTRVANLLTGRSMRQVWRKYVEAGWRKGAQRAFDDTHQRQKWERHPDTVGTTLYVGGREEFLRSSFNHPESVEKVQLLASRTYTDLDGVTTAMATKMSRTLADGLTMGQHPHQIAASLVRDVDAIGRRRSILIARTELIRAHSEGQLDNLERLGVQEVGVNVEWTVTPDKKLCPKCAAMQGLVLKTKDAHGLIPFHPECRCAFIPSFEPPSSPEEVDAALDEAEVERKPKEKGGILSSILGGIFNSRCHVPTLEQVTNSDPYRDERGRFATARDASITAIEATRKTDSTRIPGVDSRLQRMDEMVQREGDRETHNDLANHHNVLANAHDESMRSSPAYSMGIIQHSRAASLHRAAADEQWLARDRMLQIIIASRNPGFDLSDNTQRLVYADWLEENHRDPKIGAAAADHLRKYSY